MFASQGKRKVFRFVHKREALRTDMPNDKPTFFSRITFVTVAQLVERLVGDREMSGSNPPPLTILFHTNFGFFALLHQYLLFLKIICKVKQMSLGKRYEMFLKYIGSYALISAAVSRQTFNPLFWK